MHAVSAIFVGVWLVLGWRLADVQLVKHSYFEDLARQERLQDEPIPARRGGIFDANGNPLAVSVPFDSVQVVGSEVEQPELVASSLAPILELPVEEIRAKIDP